MAGVDGGLERLRLGVSCGPAAGGRGTLLIMRSGVYECGQEDVPEAVDAEVIEIIFGEIQFESSAEVSDPSFELISGQRSD